MPSVPSMLGAASYSSDTGLLRASGDCGAAQRESGQGRPGLGWGLLGTGSGRLGTNSRGLVKPSPPPALLRVACRRLHASAGSTAQALHACSSQPRAGEPALGTGESLARQQPASCGVSKTGSLPKHRGVCLDNDAGKSLPSS